MTLYLTDNTSVEEVERAAEAGVVAFKLYPAGATTNSASGVTDPDLCLPALRAMAKVRLGGLVMGTRHGCTSDRDHAPRRRCAALYISAWPLPGLVSSIQGPE